MRHPVRTTKEWAAAEWNMTWSKQEPGNVQFGNGKQDWGLIFDGGGAQCSRKEDDLEREKSSTEDMLCNLFCEEAEP